MRTKLLRSNTATSALGGTKFAGTIASSIGVGRPNMRIFGFYAMVYILNGGGEYGDSTGMRQRVSAGDLIWVFPELAHYYGPNENGPWDEIYVVMTGPLFDFWREQKIISSESPVWHLSPVDFWYNRMVELVSGPKVRGRSSALDEWSQWQNLITDMVAANRENAEETSDHSWLLRACHQLEAEGENPSLKKIAKEVGMSYDAFRKKFVQQLGVSPAKYRQARLIDKACTLLMQKDLTHRDIAERLSFCDEFHFSKVFRKTTGISPRAFRARALGHGDA